MQKYFTIAYSFHSSYSAPAGTGEKNDIISPLILKGQSIHHICVTHADSIPCCEKSIYAYTNSDVFRARNIDLPRKVSFKPRKKKSVEPKVDKTCREGRTYRDFHEFMKEHRHLQPVIRSPGKGDLPETVSCPAL